MDSMLLKSYYKTYYLKKIPASVTLQILKRQFLKKKKSLRRNGWYIANKKVLKYFSSHMEKFYLLQKMKNEFSNIV